MNGVSPREGQVADFVGDMKAFMDPAQFTCAVTSLSILNMSCISVDVLDSEDVHHNYRVNNVWVGLESLV